MVQNIPRWSPESQENSLSGKLLRALGGGGDVHEMPNVDFRDGILG